MLEGDRRWSTKQVRQQLSSVPLLEELHSPLDEPEEIPLLAEIRRNLRALGPHSTQAIQVLRAELERLFVTPGKCDSGIHLVELPQPLLGRAAERLKRKRSSIAIEQPHTLRFLGPWRTGVVDYERFVACLEDRNDRIATDADSIGRPFHGTPGWKRRDGAGPGNGAHGLQ